MDTYPAITDVVLGRINLREAIAASRRDPRPPIPAEQVFADLEAAIEQVAAEKVGT